MKYSGLNLPAHCTMLDESELPEVYGGGSILSFIQYLLSGFTINFGWGADNDSYDTSNTRGNSPSYGLNYQKLGKDLASVDELAVLDGSKCILQLRGVRPFLSDKYDLTQHPNYKYTSDFDKRNEFNIEQFLSRRLKLKAGDEFVVVDAD